MLKRFVSRVIVAAAMFSPLPALADLAFPSTRQAMSDLAQTFGYLYGQELTLSRIEEEFPTLLGQTLIARHTFNAAFPDMQQILRSIFVDMAGEEVTKEIEERAYQELDDYLKRQPLELAAASHFLEEVAARASGKMVSPMGEVILATQYRTMPAEEVRDGYFQEFSSAGHAKSEGLDLTLRLPKSWVSQEGRRPHIVQKWQSLAGHGPTILMLLIEDVGPELTQEEIDAFFAMEQYKDILPEGAEYIDSSQVMLDGQPAYSIDYYYVVKVGAAPVVMRTTQYQLFFRGKAITLQCQSGVAVGDSPLVASSTEEARALTAADSDTTKGVCQQVAHSLVLHQAW